MQKKSHIVKKTFELARIRTWNLLIRSQTRYPLRHKPLAFVAVFYNAISYSVMKAEAI